MFFYVYKITNIINGKIYIGKHKSAHHPTVDGYLGSGKQIINAIKKYGIDNFEKEILHYCSSKEEMSQKESEIVNEEFIKRVDTYNMHRGGDGGWEHINLDPQKRKSVTEKATITSREKGVGGTKYWTDESWVKVRSSISTCWSELRKRGIIGWETYSPEKKQEIGKKISQKVLGSNNGSYGTKIYIDANYDGVLPPSYILNKQRYRPGCQPEGWITTTEWKNIRKCKKGTYGTKWYNDGTSNYCIHPEDERCELLNKGRIK